MMNAQRKNRYNSLQNILITLLSVSAMILFTQTQLYNLDLTPDYSDTSSSAVSSVPLAYGLAAPVRVAVTGDYGRSASVSLTTADEAFTEPLGRRLLEALGSARDFTACASRDFLSALKGPSIYYDFLNPLPLSILAGLAGGGEEISPREDLSARCLLIAAQESGTVLYLRDGGSCYRAATAVSAGSLNQVIGLYELGGAVFAMDLEEDLDPCSLLPVTPPVLPAYTSGDPLASTDWLLSALGFNPRSRTRHTESNGTELILDGDRSLRIRPDKSVYYQCGQEPSLSIAAAGETPTIREAASGAGALLSALLNPVSGDARLYLQSVRQNGTVSVLCFDYHLNGVPVRFQNDGFAAELTLTGKDVTALIIRFRQYSPLEEPSLLLPLNQALAVAAVSPGKELSIGYVERSGECRACWLCD